MNERTYQLALAGMLHDIGKFMLRAGEGGVQAWDDEAKRTYGYKHAMLTDSFVAQYTPEPWRAALRGPAGNHHRPQTPDDRIVTLADWLSAGERRNDRDDDLPRGVKQRLSIFSAVTLDGEKLEGEALARAYLPLKPLAMQADALFPDEAQTDVDAAYRQLWEAFRQEAEMLRDAHAEEGDLSIYAENLLMLMQRYAWSIPSAYYQTTPDVSLYDHSRMTGALAAVLMDLSDDQISAMLESSHDQSTEEVALLVGGDISGVQDFIYTITSKGAASALRGRSFYLQLLTEAIARYTLRRLDLPVTNLIYQGGGNFYILARASDQEKLTEIGREINQVLLQHHQGDLYVALAGEPLAVTDFYDGRLSNKWMELAEQQQVMKLRRFSDLDAANLAVLFQPQGDGGNEDKLCQVCGREHPDTHMEKDVRKCPQCLSYEALGNDLRNARFLTLELLPESGATKADLMQAPGRAEDVLAAFGLKAHVFSDLDDAPDTEHALVMLAIKDEALEELRPGRRLAVGRRFLVNVTPTISQKEIADARKADLKELPAAGSVKPFHVLAWQSTGIKRLGVLRMDVDNLGRIFSDGLGQKATLSRVAGLSFAISLYFEGWVEQIAESMSGDRLYSIYSGGDDLFFVGSWDAVVDFARQVRADLDRYTAHHPAIHASAGIELVGGKYPLSQAARDAGEAESAAKSYLDGAHAKDAISFLGQVQPWSRFGLEARSGMDSVVGLTLLLDDMVRSGAPRSLIRQLSRLYAQYDAALQARARRGDDTVGQGQPQTLWGPWMWRGYYLLKRAKQADIRTLAQTLHEDDFRSMAWMGLAARWADLLQRR